MSREQWGNGYNKGYDDGVNSIKKPKWLIEYNNNDYISFIGYVRNEGTEYLTVEEFNYCDMVYFGQTKQKPDITQLDVDAYTQWHPVDKTYKRFYLFEEVMNEFIKDTEKRLMGNDNTGK